jgi:hypothetical protein
MPRRDSRWDDEPDDEPDDEFETDDFDPDEDWADDPDDESAILPCPRCGAEVYEDAPYCPHCDADLTNDSLDHRYYQRRHPWWIILGTLACLLIFLSWILLL